MARSHVASNAYAGTPGSVNIDTNGLPTPEPLFHGPYGYALASSEARAHHSAGIEAIGRLRKRLDIIDEHTREIRRAQDILLKQEKLLTHERDELMECLNFIEGALPTRVASYDTDDGSRPITPHNAESDSMECEESEVPRNKCHAVLDLSDRPIVRKRTSSSKDEATNQSISKSAPLAALGTEPTLIMECPPHLLQPSESLPRPPSSSPPGSFESTPAPLSLPGSVSRNGIRFLHGSAPRIHRGRSASRLNQMLPPLVASSPSTLSATMDIIPFPLFQLWF
ncbi:unnamed protein product [Rhizoctonia solani]|uniref:Uncharacterized protein n=1 Tax=Rhizoctonia solani TaxID=456999 RepID=A0A8H3A9A6_9AGAM|nr:unnamed protein product [Rhizoctonia solani]